jgi:hypothetical protein
MNKPVLSKMPVNRSPLPEIDGRLRSVTQQFRGQADHGSTLIEAWKDAARDRRWTQGEIL